MVRVLLIGGKMFCEAHQEYFREYKDAAGNSFWICLTCDMAEELQEFSKDSKEAKK